MDPIRIYNTFKINNKHILCLEEYSIDDGYSFEYFYNYDNEDNTYVNENYDNNMPINKKRKLDLIIN